VAGRADNHDVKNGIYYSNRSDPFLALGVAIVSYVLLSRPTAALRVGRDVPEVRDLRLMPAAIIAATIFGCISGAAPPAQWRAVGPRSRRRSLERAESLAPGQLRARAHAHPRARSVAAAATHFASPNGARG
jgi:hypothetical protein